MPGDMVTSINELSASSSLCTGTSLPLDNCNLTVTIIHGPLLIVLVSNLSDIDTLSLGFCLCKMGTLNVLPTAMMDNEVTGKEASTVKKQK
jgi:hypothetical protein